jgi:hypothetical protein
VARPAYRGGDEGAAAGGGAARICAAKGREGLRAAVRVPLAARLLPRFADEGQPGQPPRRAQLWHEGRHILRRVRWPRIHAAARTLQNAAYSADRVVFASCSVRADRVHVRSCVDRASTATWPRSLCATKWWRPPWLTQCPHSPLHPCTPAHTVPALSTASVHSGSHSARTLHCIRALRLTQCPHSPLHPCTPAHPVPALSTAQPRLTPQPRTLSCIACTLPR